MLQKQIGALGAKGAKKRLLNAKRSKGKGKRGKGSKRAVGKQKPSKPPKSARHGGGPPHHKLQNEDMLIHNLCWARYIMME